MTSAAKSSQTNSELIRAELPWLQSATYRQAMRFYDEVCRHSACDDETLAELGKGDRFFLLTYLLKRIDAVHPWIYGRVREVEAEPTGHLDLWARGHYKSTSITFAGSIQAILNDPEITIGIFSHTRPIAKAFLAQIKREFEGNEVLHRLYPEVLWGPSQKDAPAWSLDSGIVVRRKSNPKESTVEAWGLVDGQPTSKHFRLVIYDDVVTRESVTTAEQIAKTTEAWELSQNLKSKDGKEWYVGTRYNYADTYHTLLTRGVVKPRIHAATDTGTVDGTPVFLTQEQWEKKVQNESLYTIACQQLQNPNAGGEQELKPEWFRYYEVRPKTLNVYITCDYAGGRKSTGSSNTAIAVIGVDHALNKYLLDGVCHKLSLTERWTAIRDFRRKWLRQPGVQVVKVGYERFGAQSDIEHFETMMRIEGESFPIDELNWPNDGPVSKDNRIRRLEPDHRNWRFFYPASGDMTTSQRDAKNRGEEYIIAKPIKKKNQEGRVYDVTDWYLKNEYLFFPNTTQKDFLDALSRIYDMDPQPPLIYNDEMLEPEVFADT